ncbi:alpha/beta fold hydrolase [Streptomyces sp. ISL-66]|uniref:alpha/beta fold hydrolase n=1 Tax=Streptomyces sp. ISL-66 TaxID=2819186 RepID=UPI0035B12E1C
MPFIGTASNAKDIELLRQALGEETLSFYGRCFGSYVGTVYAAQFPRRVRAMVLDGAYDPRRYVPYAYDAGQFVALDGAVGRFLDWCAQKCRHLRIRRRPAAAGLRRPQAGAGRRPRHHRERTPGHRLHARLPADVQHQRGQGDLALPGTGPAGGPGTPGFVPAVTALPLAVECADRVYPASYLLLGTLVSAHVAEWPALRRDHRPGSGTPGVGAARRWGASPATGGCRPGGGRCR